MYIRKSEKETTRKKEGKKKRAKKKEDSNIRFKERIDYLEEESGRSSRGFSNPVESAQKISNLYA